MKLDMQKKKSSKRNLKLTGESALPASVSIINETSGFCPVLLDALCQDTIENAKTQINLIVKK